MQTRLTLRLDDELIRRAKHLRSLSILACVVSISVLPHLYAAEQFEREYSFSTDSTVEVLTITSSGGMVGGRSHITLFGDGHLVYQPHNPADPVEETHLTYTEVDEIVRALVDGGIMDWNQANVFHRLRKAGVSSSWTDLPTVEVKIVLDRYRNAAGENAPAVKELSYSWSPALIKLVAPEAKIPEVEALAFVRSHLRAHLSEANEK